MEILVLSQYWFPEEGAPQRRWQWLSGILKDLGHNVTAIAPPPVYRRRLSKRQWLNQQLRSVFRPSGETGPSGEMILRSPFVQAGRSIRIRALNQIVVSVGTTVTAVRRTVTTGSKPDIVIGTVPALPTLFAARAVSRFFRIPLVVDLRDAWPELLTDMEDWGKETTRAGFIAGLRSTGILKSVLAHIFLASYGRASAIIVTTDSHAESLKRSIGRGAPPIHVIRNVFPPSVALERPEKNVSEHEFNSLNVLYAGTVGRAQQITNAVEAVAIARDYFAVHVNLRIIGDGAGWEAVKKHAAELDIPLDLRHHISPRDLTPHYQWADTALVHLAAWHALETTVPSKLYELMVVGKHITVVANGEAARLVRDLEAGATVTPGDPEKLARVWSDLANDRPLRASTAGREWVQHQAAVASDTLRAVIEDVQ